MIEMLGDLLRGIFGLINKGELEDASEKLSRIYYDMLKQEAVFFRSIPQDELTDKLLREHNFTNGHLEILAELFNAEAELQMARGNKKECAEYSLKALVLFEFIDKEQKTYSYERIKRMEGLRERIKSIR